MRAAGAAEAARAVAATGEGRVVARVAVMVARVAAMADTGVGAAVASEEAWAVLSVATAVVKAAGEGVAAVVARHSRRREANNSRVTRERLRGSSR